MKTECYPVSILPHQTRLFLDYVEGREPLLPFYPVAPFAGGLSWSDSQSKRTLADRGAAAQLLRNQPGNFNQAPATLENLKRLEAGASAIVTGQQVGLLGGPLLTLFKAATAIRLAQDLTAAGKPHVPIFWMATEDHDFAEVDHVVVPSRHDLHRLQLHVQPGPGQPVGSVLLGEPVRDVLTQAAEFLGGTPLFERIEEWYAPGKTMAEAFGAFIAHVFASWGLIVVDASSRSAHQLGSAVLRDAILRADELQAALVARDEQLKAHGYHSQVLVTPESSLLFLVDESGSRQVLRRVQGSWKAGGRIYTEAELLGIFESGPERISPNALLRPVFQDAILPTTGYVGGPAEIAYFAQSEVLYQRLLGRTTPILPRLSATLIEPSISTLLERHEISLPQVIDDAGDLAQRLGARSLPIEGKQHLAKAGNALDAELTELTAWMASMDESLGRAATVSASKMRYQMNRLRRLAANFQLQKEASLQRHADALKLSLFPEKHLQERRIAGAYYLARYGEEIVSLFIDAADSYCPGHKAVWLS